MPTGASEQQSTAGASTTFHEPINRCVRACARAVPRRTVATAMDSATRRSHGFDNRGRGRRVTTSAGKLFSSRTRASIVEQQIQYRSHGRDAPRLGR